MNRRSWKPKSPSRTPFWRRFLDDDYTHTELYSYTPISVIYHSESAEGGHLQAGLHCDPNHWRSTNDGRIAVEEPKLLKKQASNIVMVWLVTGSRGGSLTVRPRHMCLGEVQKIQQNRTQVLRTRCICGGPCRWCTAWSPDHRCQVLWQCVIAVVGDPMEHLALESTLATLATPRPPVNNPQYLGCNPKFPRNAPVLLNGSPASLDGAAELLSGSLAGPSMWLAAARLSAPWRSNPSQALNGGRQETHLRTMGATWQASPLGLDPWLMTLYGRKHRRISDSLMEYLTLAADQDMNESSEELTPHPADLEGQTGKMRHRHTQFRASFLLRGGVAHSAGDWIHRCREWGYLKCFLGWLSASTQPRAPSTRFNQRRWCAAKVEKVPHLSPLVSQSALDAWSAWFQTCLPLQSRFSARMISGPTCLVQNALVRTCLALVSHLSPSTLILCPRDFRLVPLVSTCLPIHSE